MTPKPTPQTQHIPSYILAPNLPPCSEQEFMSPPHKPNVIHSRIRTSKPNYFLPPPLQSPSGVFLVLLCRLSAAEGKFSPQAPMLPQEKGHPKHLKYLPRPPLQLCHHLLLFTLLYLLFQNLYFFTGRPHYPCPFPL